MSKPNLEVLKELMQEGTFNLPDYSDPKYDEDQPHPDLSLAIDIENDSSGIKSSNNVDNLLAQNSQTKRQKQQIDAYLSTGKLIEGTVNTIDNQIDQIFQIQMGQNQQNPVWMNKKRQEGSEGRAGVGEQKHVRERIKGVHRYSDWVTYKKEKAKVTVQRFQQLKNISSKIGKLM